MKYSPVSKREQFVYYLLLLAGLTTVIAFALWWFQLSHVPHNFQGFLHSFDYLIFVLLSFVVWHQIMTEAFSWFVALRIKHPSWISPEPKWRVAFLTAFVPGKEPYDVLEKTLEAMVRADYSHETWLLDEGNDPEAKRICQRLKVKHYSRKGILKYNTKDGPFKAKTKAGNYNSWFHEHRHRYEFVAQLDVDFVPEKKFLTRMLGYFSDPSVAFVESPQIYGNLKESWIARGAAEQAYNFYGSMQKGFFGNDMTLFIGANHIVRVASHDDIEGYSGHIVEDHLTGMRFYANHWKSVYVPEILAVGEGPATWDAYFGQQMRWAFGLIHILFTESPRLFPRMKFRHAVNYYFLQQYYFYGLAQVAGLLLITLYFGFGIYSTEMSLWIWCVLYPPILMMQLTIFLWLQRYGVDPKQESGLMLRGKFLNFAAWPIYFLAFISVLVGKRLTYQVTPKGSGRRSDPRPFLFIPHLILGALTGVDIVLALLFHRQAPQLLFWTVLNTVVMFYFFFSVFGEWLGVRFTQFRVWFKVVLPRWIFKA